MLYSYRRFLQTSKEVVVLKFEDVLIVVLFHLEAGLLGR
jgi:hypothetical protein